MSSPDELHQLNASNQERLRKINESGARVNGIPEHWTGVLLAKLGEHVLGPEGWHDFQLGHERWLQAELDQAEVHIQNIKSQQARAALIAGANQFVGGANARRS